VASALHASMEPPVMPAWPSLTCAVGKIQGTRKCEQESPVPSVRLIAEHCDIQLCGSMYTLFS